MRGLLLTCILRGSVAALSLCALPWLSACGGRAASTDSGAGTRTTPVAQSPVGLGTLLPTPRNLPEGSGPAAGRQVSDAQLSLTGDNYDLLAPNNLVTDGAFGTGIYQPQYAPGDPLSTAAYAVYSFTVASYSGPGEVHIGWFERPPAETVWIGLADYANDRWVWHANPVGSVLPFDYASGNFTSPGGFVHVAVLAATSNIFYVESVALGSNTLPVLKFNNSFNKANAGSTTTLDASPSYDPDGSIVKYEFDPEGDGTFVDKGSVPRITHKYATGGVVNASVRITDNDGATVTWQHTVYVSWQTSIIGAAGSNTTTAALYDRQLECVYFAGILQGLGQGDEEGFVGQYDLGGQVFWEKTFGTAGKDEFQGLAQDSSRNLYVSGLLGYDGEMGTGVLVKLDSDGNLIWQKEFDGQFHDTPKCRADSQDHLYFAGNLDNGLANPHTSYLAQLDGDGNINWQKTCLSGTNCETYDCCLDSADNIYLAGRVKGLAGDNISGLLVSFDPGGTLRYARSLDTGKDESFYSVCTDSTTVYLAGSRYLNPNDDSLIAGASRAGLLNWAESYSSGALEEGLYGGGVPLDGGGCILSGDCLDGGDFYNALLLQLNPDGSLALQKSFGRDGFLDQGYCVTAGPVGDYYIAGEVKNPVGAYFSNVSGTLTPQTTSLLDVPSPVVADGALTLSDSSAVLAPLSGETRDTGGALIAQFYPDPSP